MPQCTVCGKRYGKRESDEETQVLILFRGQYFCEKDFAAKRNPPQTQPVVSASSSPYLLKSE